MIKTLEYYVRYDRQDAVQIGIVVAIPGMDPMRSVITGSDAALTAHAVAAGRSTWDEDTICAVHDLVRAPLPPAPVEVPE
jgi:hypothetical protein